MKSKTLILSILSIMASLGQAEQLLDDDWGQWESVDMSDKYITDESLDGLNKLDGVHSANTNDSSTLSSDVLFELWQIENDIQIVDNQELNESDKQHYLQWVAEFNLLSSNDNNAQQVAPTFVPNFDNSNIPSPFTTRTTTVIAEVEPPAQNNSQPEYYEYAPYVQYPNQNMEHVYSSAEYSAHLPQVIIEK